MSSSMLHVRMDDELKRQAVAALDAIGLSTADAVRMLFKRIVAEQAFPLELKVPNAETRAAMEESAELLRNGSLRFSTAEELFASLDQNLGK